MNTFPLNMIHLAYGKLPSSVISLSIVLSTHNHTFRGFFSDVDCKCYGITVGLLFYELHIGLLV